MLLQESIEELNSAIINVCDNRIELTGFLSSERLLDYYDNGYDCRYFTGVFPVEPFDIAYVKNNSLILLLDNGIEQIRYNFVPIKNDTVKFKLPGDKIQKSKVYTIRQCSVGNIYNYKDMEISLLFNTKLELQSYFLNEFGIELEL